MKFYVNKRPQFNWDHEVHTANCVRLPSQENREYLWDFISCKQAVQEAKKRYPKADGCAHCCPICHTS